jgi:BNR/Asp-box repeat
MKMPYRRPLAAAVAVVLSALLIPGSGSAQSAASRRDAAAWQFDRLRSAPWDVGAALEGEPKRARAGREAAFLKRIERFRCRTAGDPAASVDMSCNVPRLGQQFNPDNEITVVVDPEDPNHLLAGSNDYFYRFRGFTRLTIAATGFFTSFDGGRTWIDGQVPFGVNNEAGDPSPAFDAKHDVALMASLDFFRPPESETARNGHITVSRSTDGGRTWREPVRVMTGRGADPNPRQVFFDKEWLTVDNNPNSPYYGRAYVTATRFFGGESYQESPIYLSYSDDGGRTWSRPTEISGSHPSCTFQTTGAARECDEDQFSIPEVAPDGTVYVHYANFQNEAAWEVDFDFDGQIMVVRSTNGGQTFSQPVQAVQVEDGLSDTPYNVNFAQTVWGHQFRWIAYGNISTNPADADDLAIVFADRDTPNPNATDECILQLFEEGPQPPDYDPCNAGPSMDTDVSAVVSSDGGKTWSDRQVIRGTPTSVWFPWADHGPDGDLAVAWDEDTEPAPADLFHHVLWTEAGGVEVLNPPPTGDRLDAENPDIAVTHWAGQYVTEPSAFPRICGPAGYSDPPIENAEGKDCSVFIGDYTGLAVGPDGRANVVWTGQDRWATSPQLDPYTGERHDGYAQDALFARR